MQTQRVGIEVAKLLKKLNYNKFTNATYANGVQYKGRFFDLDEEMELRDAGHGSEIKTALKLYYIPYVQDLYPEGYPAPSQDEVNKWLRDTFDVCVVVEPNGHATVGGKTIDYHSWVWFGFVPQILKDNVRTTYEETMEVALKYTLKQLTNYKWLWRLDSESPENGLWYNASGDYCFGIGKLEGCKTKDLPMDYDERYRKDGKHWFSSCSNVKDLSHWYSLEDARQLMDNGFVFTRYFAKDYVEYENQTCFLKETALVREVIPFKELEKHWKNNN